MHEVEVGKVTHYWDHIGVAGVHVEQKGFKVGDTLHIVGHATDLTQIVSSIQLEHQGIEEAKPGQDIGLKVADQVREHDTIYKQVDD